MTNNQDQINELLRKLEMLLKKQADFTKEVNDLQRELIQLKKSDLKISEKEKLFEIEKPVENEIIEFQPTPIQTEIPQKIVKEIIEEPVFTPPIQPVKTKSNINLEKFIGENLINKIGIAITIIGVAIGTKYSIEHDLISPLTRVILGYLVGVGLLGFGIKLKIKYESFSAVLVSGAISILYFMTYAAYSFYQLFPQTVAFGLMVIFTVFTVIAALNYNKQIIAHIGLVGAYAVPFLLSENSGNATVLFSYMAIINMGILIIAIKKYWKPLYFTSFLLTWIIFLSWYIFSYKMNEHFAMALTFALLFFVIFYATFISFKLFQKEKFNTTDILLLLANSFIFYGIGYSILDNHETGTQLLGLFTLGNGLLHFIVSVLIFKQKLADKKLFYLVSGLVLVFITIAIPVQLDGNWVTLLWIGEAALLFWIGRLKAIPVYEYISYVLMLLAMFSIYQDWETNYTSYYYSIEEKITPIFNIHFLTSVLFIASLGFIYAIHSNEKFHSPLKDTLKKIVSFLIPAALVSTIYVAFRLELVNYFQNLFNASEIKINEFDIQNNYDILKFETSWVLNYTLLFVAVLSFLNIKKLKNRTFGLVNLALNTLAITVFLTQGLYVLSELRENYLQQIAPIYYKIDAFNIGIRYISVAFVALVLFACYQYIRQEFMKVNLKMPYSLLLHITILWIASNELISWLDMADSTQSYKLGLSILWGIYSLLLISLGIWKNKKYLRIGAIALFSITLLKLFLYDISHLDTISKTVVFLSLGILLLIISYLYNKFKHQITDEIEN